MSLKDNVNNTNTQKDKLKRGKQNIDNKFIALGGVKAENIEDVPRKMDFLVKNNYKRTASGRVTAKWDYNIFGWEVPINLKFKPSRIFAMQSLYLRPEENCSNIVIDSQNDVTLKGYIFKIHEITADSFKISTNNTDGRTIDITWFAVE